jgi:hypothetical protein
VRPNIGRRQGPTWIQPPPEETPMNIRLSQAVAAAFVAGFASLALAQADPQAPQAIQNPQDHEQAPSVAVEEQKGQAAADQDATQNPESTPPSSVAYANPPKSNKVPSYLANLHFTQEPIARALKSDGDDPLVKGIVDALNNDGSLQSSKITVSNDDGVVTLTGATMTPDQKAKVNEIAIAQAGDGKVINNVLDSIT